jgi:hypothetical protein
MIAACVSSSTPAPFPPAGFVRFVEAFGAGFAGAFAADAFGAALAAGFAGAFAADAFGAGLTDAFGALAADAFGPAFAGAFAADAFGAALAGAFGAALLATGLASVFACFFFISSAAAPAGRLRVVVVPVATLSSFSRQPPRPVL